ncbi:MAG TPA: histidine--tRNA ligase [Dermatophilaceae bacterium]|nr:histidine--tRNA ligase [Dermatophilaceae bacterium]
MSHAKITPLSGFPEWLPAQRAVEQHVLDVIRRTFELHGFISIETRAVEPIDRLTDKGADTDKEIYAVSRLADAPIDTRTRGREPELGLHFDLTVPFARYVLENAGRLTFPFRRYQIQKVWRGERPQEGRFREFTQADIDIVDVGQLPAHYEAELPLVVADALGQLPIGPFRVQVNNRKISEGVYRGLGLTDITGTLRTVDKLGKIGPTAVADLLVAAGATQAQAAVCLQLAGIRGVDASVADQVRHLGVQHPVVEEGLTELTAVLQAAHAHAPGLLQADLSVARGLDYYTGTVYETQLVGHESYGSICSGGRYDALASDGRTTYPGVGISIGVSRLLAKVMPGLTVTRATPSVVLVAVASEADRPSAMWVAARLRRRGIAVEVAPAAAKFGKQIRFADRRGIPYVWFPARDALEAAPAGAAGTAGGVPEAAFGGIEAAVDQVKDIRSGLQVDADPDSWCPPEVDLRPCLVSSSTLPPAGAF